MIKTFSESAIPVRPPVAALWPFVALLTSACVDGADEELGDEAFTVAFTSLAQRTTSLELARDGLPWFATGELGRVSDIGSEAEVRRAIADELPAFKLRDDQLVLERVFEGENGDRFYRFGQVEDGVDVVGGMLVAHIDVYGTVFAINGTARGDIATRTIAYVLSDADARRAAFDDPELGQLAVERSDEVYLVLEDRSTRRAYRVELSDGRTDRRTVYIDGVTGATIARAGWPRYALNRRVYIWDSDLEAAERSEGSPDIGHDQVDRAFHAIGRTWQVYNNFWGRTVIGGSASTYQTGQVLVPMADVFGTQTDCNGKFDYETIWLGQGASGCLSPDNALDYVAHEYTHGVTIADNDLNDSGEANGLEEAFSDIFGALVEAWNNAGDTGTTLRVNAHTWLFGERLGAPKRAMCDPQYNLSNTTSTETDLYYTPNFGNLDEHEQANVTNLMFCLLVRGGAHPRGDTQISVPGIGFDKAIRILYSARVLVPAASTIEDLRSAMASTALSNYGTGAQTAVQCAFAAVGVGATPLICNRADLLWRNDTDGAVAIWRMNGPTGVTPIYTTPATMPPATWTMLGPGDFDGDAKADILWRQNTTGEIRIWRMFGGSTATSVSFTAPLSDWQVKAIGDIDGGGTSDILFQQNTGALALWRMNNGGQVTLPVSGTLGSDMTIKGVCDFNRDGRSDILLRRTVGSTYEARVWRAVNDDVGGLMELTLANAKMVDSARASTNWELEGCADMNGDGMSDILWREKAATGRIDVWTLAIAGQSTVTIDSAKSGFAREGTTEITAGPEWTVSVLGDVTGDGRSDIVWRHNGGMVHVWVMNGRSILMRADSGLTPGTPVPTSYKIRGIASFN